MAVGRFVMPRGRSIFSNWNPLGNGIIINFASLASLRFNDKRTLSLLLNSLIFIKKEDDPPLPIKFGMLGFFR